MRALRSAALGLVALAVSAAACDSGPSSGEEAKTNTPAANVETTTISSERQRQLAELQAKLDAVKSLDAAGFAAKYSLPFVPDLGYDPLVAQGLDRVQASSVALNDGERAALASRGFVITDRQRYPTFVYGYQTIYTDDLPVYVSADSILYAVHKSFDTILAAIEANALAPVLERLLGSMRGALTRGVANDISSSPDARRDADVYLAVALSLLKGSVAKLSDGSSSAAVQSLFDKANAASGAETVALFGRPREMDFSQFEPRGHYAESPLLRQYFRAMMWLGRIDLRLLETLPDHTQVFNRRQVEATYVLRALMDNAAVADWKTIDTTIGAFVGEPDNMTVPQTDSLLTDLHITNGAELAKLSDQTIAQAISNGAYGAQRISSHIMVNGLGSGTMPLSSTFLLLGQRYVLDSHVFSNVVYDRVQHGKQFRMLPNPLDVSFAALKNDQAGLLLAPELERFHYASDLASMRILADDHPAEFWSANLYNEWLTMLRALSPKKDEVANPASVGLPRIAGTEAWGRRILNAQHASWAELRHDTLLYAKQSYTGAASCEYPDAYVDPYPELFARLGAYATHGSTLTAALQLPGSLAANITQYFSGLQNVAATLETMAKNQRIGTPHTAEQMAFINTLTFQQGCGSLGGFDGWYAKLFFNKESALQLDPIVADVHTQPTDEAGSPVGRVLHVGTGMPRTMVVTIDTCSGPRAYVGVASSYFERVTEQYKRYNDQDWMKELVTTPPQDVPWMGNLVHH
jgi:hypothetical protein